MDTLIEELSLLPIATLTLAGTAIGLLWHRNRQRRERIRREQDAQLRLADRLLQDIREREREHLAAADHRQRVLQAERQVKHLQSAVTGTVTSGKPSK